MAGVQSESGDNVERKEKKSTSNMSTLKLEQGFKLTGREEALLLLNRGI
jgi:hypothetical protein